jgi:hypothetical protein
MAKISTYSLADEPLQLSDRLIGTEAPRPTPSTTPLATRNFSLGELLQLFSQNFPAASLQAVLNTGNTATQDINLTGSIYTTLIKPLDIEDILGSTGSTFQVLSKATTGINWVDLPTDNLQTVLNAGNTATQNIILIGNISSTLIIPGNIQDEDNRLGSVGQVLTKTISGIAWKDVPSSFTAGLNDVLLVGNTATNDIILTGDISVIDAHVSGALYDSNDSQGTAGQILSSTGVGTEWISATQADKTYIYVQSIPSVLWNINHNLDKFPSVSVVNINNVLLYGEVTYIDSNNLTIAFSAGFSGKAYMN